MDKLILKYLEKEMSIEDQHKLTKWLNEDKMNRKVLEKIDLYWKKNRDHTQEVSADVWLDLVSKIHQSERKADSSRRKKMVRYFLRVAAMLIIGLVSSILYLHFEERPVEQVRYLEKISLNGQKINIQLADGSRVKLNSGSKLITPERFSSDLREVELEGEAFFDVAEEADRPFIIKSGDIKIRVHGTSFNVRAYPEESDISVAVASGKVSVSDVVNNSPVYILPDELAIYDREDKVTKKGSFDRREYFGWKNKEIVFKNSNIDEIFAKLSRWYGIAFQVDTQLDRKKDFSGFYSNDPSLEEVMKGISYVYEFDFEIKKDMVMIN